MYEDLISLAEHIATLDAGRPKQAHLRRAVSTAYYAVFHFLVEESCRVQFGAQPAQRAYRNALGRAFVHTVMKEACRRFGAGSLKDSVVKGLPRDASGNYTIPKEIQNIAAVFTELQEKRHLADYDLSERFRRSEVVKLIDEAKKQVENFQLMAPTEGLFGVPLGVEGACEPLIFHFVPIRWGDADPRQPFRRTAACVGRDQAEQRARESQYIGAHGFCGGARKMNKDSRSQRGTEIVFRIGSA